MFEVHITPGYILRVTSVALVIVVALVLALVLWMRTGVKRLRTLHQRHRDSLKLLLNELDDRYDLVPALIAASAGAGVERAALRPVVGARALAIEMRDQRLGLAERAGAENALSAALHELIGSLDEASHWPFVRVARELQMREQRIAGSVQVFNDLGRSINRAVERFPTSMFATLGAIRAVSLFEAPAPVEIADAAAPPVPAAQTTETTGKVPEGDSGTVAA